MTSISLKIILTTTALYMFTSAYSQNSSKQEMISVKLDIVGKGTITKCKGSSTYYFVTVNVLNTQDTAVSFWVNSCSWPWNGFVSNVDSIFFQGCSGGCDRDEVEKITLLPKKRCQFYCTIISIKKDSSIPWIKTGFRYITNSADLWISDEANNKKKKNIIFWSNEVELKNNLYSFEIK